MEEAEPLFPRIYPLGGTVWSTRGYLLHGQHGYYDAITESVSRPVIALGHSPAMLGAQSERHAFLPMPFHMRNDNLGIKFVRWSCAGRRQPHLHSRNLRPESALRVSWAD